MPRSGKSTALTAAERRGTAWGIRDPEHQAQSAEFLRSDPVPHPLKAELFGEALYPAPGISGFQNLGEDAAARRRWQPREGLQQAWNSEQHKSPNCCRKGASI